MSQFVPSVVTSTSGSLIQARKRVLSQYRDWIRSSPTIVDIYKLDITSRTLRARIRQEFEKHRFVTDLQVIDILLFKGRTEYEETMNFWKQKSHVMRFFSNDPYQTTKDDNFLGKFFKVGQQIKFKSRTQLTPKQSMSSSTKVSYSEYQSMTLKLNQKNTLCNSVYASNKTLCQGSRQQIPAAGMPHTTTSTKTATVSSTGISSTSSASHQRSYESARPVQSKENSIRFIPAHIRRKWFAEAVALHQYTPAAVTISGNCHTKRLSVVSSSDLYQHDRLQFDSSILNRTHHEIRYDASAPNEINRRSAQHLIRPASAPAAVSKSQRAFSTAQETCGSDSSALQRIYSVYDTPMVWKPSRQQGSANSSVAYQRRPSSAFTQSEYQKHNHLRLSNSKSIPSQQISLMRDFGRYCKNRPASFSNQADEIRQQLQKLVLRASSSSLSISSSRPPSTLSGVLSIGKHQQSVQATNEKTIVKETACKSCQRDPYDLHDSQEQSQPAHDFLKCSCDSASQLDTSLDATRDDIFPVSHCTTNDKCSSIQNNMEKVSNSNVNEPCFTRPETESKLESFKQSDLIFHTDNVDNDSCTEYTMPELTVSYKESESYKVSDYTLYSKTVQEPLKKQITSQSDQEFIKIPELKIFWEVCSSVSDAPPVNVITPNKPDISTITSCLSTTQQTADNIDFPNGLKTIREVRFTDLNTIYNIDDDMRYEDSNSDLSIEKHHQATDLMHNDFADAQDGLVLLKPKGMKKKTKIDTGITTNSHAIPLKLHKSLRKSSIQTIPALNSKLPAKKKSQISIRVVQHNQKITAYNFRKDTKEASSTKTHSAADRNKLKQEIESAIPVKRIKRAAAKNMKP
ncbi:hypothetical protein BDV3_005114 [Batrachochytrium dendrobatidis]